MKKIATILTAVAMLASNGAFAQQKGAGAQAGKTCSNHHFAWGIGFGMLAVVGIVVGVIVGASTGNPSSFSH